MAVSRKIYVVAAIFALAVPFSGCGETPSEPLQPTGPETGLIGSTLQLVGQILPIMDTVSAETIGPEGGTLEIAGGHSLYFPAGALDDSVTITAVRDPLRIMVNFGPEGLVFPDSAQPVLTYSYANTGLLGLLNPGGFEIVFLDGLLLEEVLPSEIDTQTRVVRAELSHFSTYALATD